MRKRGPGPQPPRSEAVTSYRLKLCSQPDQQSRCAAPLSGRSCQGQSRVQLLEPDKLIIGRCATDEANEVMHHRAVAVTGGWGGRNGHGDSSSKSRLPTPLLDVIVG